MNDINFSLGFEALTGYAPLRWQIRLYDRFRNGDVPVACDLPTGLGKTSVIPIWLIAFAAQMIARETPKLPRRLIYVVNRRTVVDQATDIAQRLQNRILGQEAVAPSFTKTLKQLRDALRQATAARSDQPIAISTLRGELADNEEWKADPARPAIIVGTVDMIGSKLLFCGYGDGYRMRPHHAGLIGQDSLIVHDEAHLTPAFSTLLRAVAEEQERCDELRPVKVIELSATALEADKGRVFGLEPEDETDALVPQRLDATKLLSLRRVAKKESSKAIVKSALNYQSATYKVLIYVRSPEIAKEIVRDLKTRLEASGDERVALLTGTIRGHERDGMVKENRVYRALLEPESRVEKTVYLVSTSAGEVGIDLDADHMICDLTTLDSMIQRLGRVNRRGGDGRIANVDVIVEAKDDESKKKEKETESQASERAVASTKPALEEKLQKREDGTRDASPRALRRLLKEMSEEEREQAFAPKPCIVRATDILFDAWSLTSVRKALPGRPEAAPYLHGLTADPPETYLVWRAEMKLLADADVQKEVLTEWFRRCRIEARERLRDGTDRVAKELEKIAKRSTRAMRVAVLTERGEAELIALVDLLNRAPSALEYRTIVLPVDAAGLTDEGSLDGGVTDLKSDCDVAELGGMRRREVIRCAGDRYWSSAISAVMSRNTEPEALTDGQEFSSIERAAAGIARYYNKVVSTLLPLLPPSEGEEETEARYLLLLVEPKQATVETPESIAYDHRPKLDEHLRQAGWWADRIATALRLQDSQKDALVTAARWHDQGKDRSRWQRAIFNDEPNVVYAKSGPRGMDWRRLGGYRHEFGSLLDAAKNDEVRELPEAELALHLIAAHHGRGRPHFEADAWDTEGHTTAENTHAAQEVMRRFGHLQHRFGRWGLAWLESLLRCCDVMASQQTVSQPPEESK